MMCSPLLPNKHSTHYRISSGRKHPAIIFFSLQPTCRVSFEIRIGQVIAPHKKFCLAIRRVKCKSIPVGRFRHIIHKSGGTSMLTPKRGFE